MKFGVMVFPGTNNDHDCQFVLEKVLGQEVVVFWHKETSLPRVDCIVLPGGFSYGDYLRVGAIARFAPAINGLLEHAKRGGLVLGICNGFQILLELGLLPGAMMRNKSLKFICRYLNLLVCNNSTTFTSKYSAGEVIRMPIAHNEGNYFADADTLKMLQDEGRIVFQYCDEQGRLTEESNPNGSLLNIAGICNREGNILGMMPHPERSSEKMLGSEDGRRVFESTIESLLAVK